MTSTLRGVDVGQVTARHVTTFIPSFLCSFINKHSSKLPWAGHAGALIGVSSGPQGTIRLKEDKLDTHIWVLELLKPYLCLGDKDGVLVKGTL